MISFPKTIVNLLLLCSLLLVPGAMTGQCFLWGVGFGTIFDNREGNTPFATSKTFFLTQLSPEIGVSTDNGEHSVLGGVVWTQPIGCEWEGHRISPTLYYMYTGNSLKGFLGMFPRERLFRKVPDYIWNDSSYYVQKNIRGAGIEYINEKGFFQAILDWRGMQTENQREAFNIIAMGEWWSERHVPLIAGATAMMNHLACRKEPHDDEGVVDNFLFNPYVGLNIKKWASTIDSLEIRAGVLGSMTRDRILESRWKIPVGFWFLTDFRWKWLGIKEELYVGGKFFPYYSVYGSLLDQGEPYYASSFYSRTELQWHIMNKSFIKLTASLDFNFAGSDLLFYQRLILNINFDGSFQKKKS